MKLAGPSEANSDAIRRQIAKLQAHLRQLDRESAVATCSATSATISIGTILDSDDAGLFAIGHTLQVGGWVRKGTPFPDVMFLKVSDGSCCQDLQAVITKEVAATVGGFGALRPAGTSVHLEGELVKSKGREQEVELQVDRVLYLGLCDNRAGKYPLAKTETPPSLDFLRGTIHLRPRTPLTQAINRVGSALMVSTIGFFDSRGFVHVKSPVITTSDCEGAGEQFQKAAEEGEAGALKHAPTAGAKKLKQLGAQVDAHQAKAKQQGRMVGGIERLPTGGIDNKKDFFGKRAYLTVSGQLQAEYSACGHSKVYTFGPAFRAENSNTHRHLAEFQMLEPEMAFMDLEDDMDLAEEYMRHCCRHVLDNCMPDLEFLKKDKNVDSSALERLKQIAASPFARCSYTEAIDILQDHVKSKTAEFTMPVKWGMDLASEHERHLAEEVFKGPVIVYDYPKDIKAFYMRANDDGRTVAAMDVLVPKVGELIGGSQREERLEVLEARMKELGMSMEQYSAYLDLRRYGSVPHSGFGLGFERLMLLVTGLENIKDVIPFPRWPGHADF